MFGKSNDMNTYPENEKYHPIHFKQFFFVYEVMGLDLLDTLYTCIDSYLIEITMHIQYSTRM